MDEVRFDAIARSLATGLPRRRLLAGITAGLLSSPLGNRPRAAGAGACKKPGRPCDKNQDCCDGADCKGGECKCKADRDECAGTCFKLDTDEERCGSCNNACRAAETCCAGGCVETQVDPDNCGGCGDRCRATEECIAGTCTPPPGCLGAGARCFLGNNTCCSQICTLTPGSLEGTTCGESAAGDPCLDNGDCAGSRRCIGFVCTA